MSHILFVDDDPDTLQLIKLMLGRRGFRVTTASGGARALKAMQDDLPDLVLLDLMMPVMDGYEVCRQIRANPRTAHVPVVVLSARAHAESRVEAFRCGADDYLTKPVRSSELIAHIEAVLERAAPASPTAEPGTAIGILGSQGGAGTTMVAVNVAAALVAEQKVALADFVPQGAVSAYLGLETTGGVGSLLSQPIGSIDQTTVLAEMVSHPSGLRVLGGSLDATLGLDTHRARAILSVLLDIVDVAVVDLGPGLDPVARAVLPHCGAVALVVGGDRATLIQSQRMLAALLKVGIAEEKILPVCVNYWGAVGELSETAVPAELERPLYGIVDYGSEEVYQAIQQGDPLVLSGPESPTGQVLKTLARELVRSAQTSTHEETR